MVLTVEVKAFVQGKEVHESIDESNSSDSISMSSKAHTVYHIGIAYEKQMDLVVQARFSTIRKFRNDLLVELKKNSKHCALLAAGKSTLSILEYGFPQRKLFGSSSAEIIHDRCYKLQNCLFSIIQGHEECTVSDCGVRGLLDNFLNSPLARQDSVSSSERYSTDVESPCISSKRWSKTETTDKKKTEESKSVDKKVQKCSKTLKIDKKKVLKSEKHGKAPKSQRSSSRQSRKDALDGLPDMLADRMMMYQSHA